MRCQRELSVKDVEDYNQFSGRYCKIKYSVILIKGSTYLLTYDFSREFIGVTQSH